MKFSLTYFIIPFLLGCNNVIEKNFLLNDNFIKELDYEKICPESEIDDKKEFYYECLTNLNEVLLNETTSGIYILNLSHSGEVVEYNTIIIHVDGSGSARIFDNSLYSRNQLKEISLSEFNMVEFRKKLNSNYSNPFISLNIIQIERDNVNCDILPRLSEAVYNSLINLTFFDDNKLLKIKQEEDENFKKLKSL